MIVLSTGACGALLALGPSACIPDLPSGAVGGLDALPDASPSPHCGDGIVQLSLGEQCDPGIVAADGATPAVGCSARCQVSCAHGVHWSRNDHCYVDLQPAALSIDDAVNRCAQAGMHVVTFASDEELATVVSGLDAGAFWVGMYEGLNKFDSVTTLEPAWQPGCDGCFVHTPAPGQPLPGADASPACVEGLSDLDASWQQVPCATLRRLYHVICEWEPTALSAGRLSQPCEGGVCFDLRFTFGSKHYVYVKESAGADYAQQQCASLGGTLVVLQSRDEREQLWKELARMSGVGLPGAFWIGLSILDGGADWAWADDAAVDAYPPPWALRQPREGGARAFAYQNGGTPPQVDETLAHVDVVTTGYYPYVCQLPARED